ncbi:MAG TPA: cupin domain-containing protein [Ramlibacter sp.]|jgi:quercetin dioxygenase-like cupin family protein|nr:cupin domain-containing protein [Ramlibacter sp.]
MALPHANPLDVINVAPLGPSLRRAVSTSLIKTQRIQLLHLVLPAHHDLPQHHVADECSIHCLEGEVEVVMPGGTRHLRPGNLVVLPAGQPYALRARSDSGVLMTLLLQDGDAGDGGGNNGAGTFIGNDARP